MVPPPQPRATRLTPASKQAFVKRLTSSSSYKSPYNKEQFDSIKAEWDETHAGSIKRMIFERETRGSESGRGDEPRPGPISKNLRMAIGLLECGDPLAMLCLDDGEASLLLSRHPMFRQAQVPQTPTRAERREWSSLISKVMTREGSGREEDLRFMGLYRQNAGFRKAVLKQEAQWLTSSIEYYWPACRQFLGWLLFRDVSILIPASRKVASNRMIDIHAIIVEIGQDGLTSNKYNIAKHKLTSDLEDHDLARDIVRYFHGSFQQRSVKVPSKEFGKYYGRQYDPEVTPEDARATTPHRGRSLSRQRKKVVEQFLASFKPNAFQLTPELIHFGFQRLRVYS